MGANQQQMMAQKIAAGGGSPVTFVQKVNGSGSGGGASDSCALTSIGTGNALLVAIQWRGTSGLTVSSVSDGTNSYTIVGSPIVTTGSNYPQTATQWAYALNVTGGSKTVTATMSAGTFVWCHVVEVTAAHFDQVVSATGTGTTVNPGTATTANNGSFGAVSASTDDGFGSGSSFTAGVSWTIFANIGGGSFDAGGQYQAQAVAGSLAGAFTATFGGAWATSMLVMKP